MKPFAAFSSFSTLALCLGLLLTVSASATAFAGIPEVTCADCAKCEADEAAPAGFKAAGGGKSSRGHAQAQAAKEAADKAEALRTAERAERRAA